MKEWWEKRKDDVLMAVLVCYVISLMVVTVDTIFGPWLFPPKLDRQIAEQIKKLKSSDPGAQDAAVKDLIIDKGDFAVPALIKLLKKSDTPPPVQAKAIEALSKITEQNVGNDPQSWISWYNKNRGEFP